jgi:hypothetical protein
MAAVAGMDGTASNEYPMEAFVLLNFLVLQALTCSA